MIRYCLEIGAEQTIIHRVDCSAFDLGSLLGLGRLADLGEFRNAAQAREVIEHTHPGAVRCQNCCQAEVLLLPRLALAPVAKSRP